jgi:hypothetical protein
LYDNRLLSKAAAFPGTPRDKRELEFFDAGFDATWELDLFGRVRRSVRRRPTPKPPQPKPTASMCSSAVTAEVARNYLELRGQQNQLAVARKNAEVQKETLQITDDRLRGGRGTDFDVSRSRSLLNLTLSTIPPLEAGIQKTIHRIAVLTGQQPTDSRFRSFCARTRFRLSCLSSHSTVLKRCFVVVRMFAPPNVPSPPRLRASVSPQADLFPRVSFVGSVGLQADTFAGLGQSGADRWNFGPRITWAALDLGRVLARIKARRRSRRRIARDLRTHRAPRSGRNGERARRFWTRAIATAVSRNFRPGQSRRRRISRINVSKEASQIFSACSTPNARCSKRRIDSPPARRDRHSFRRRLQGTRRRCAGCRRKAIAGVPARFAGEVIGDAEIRNERRIDILGESGNKLSSERRWHG